MHKEINGIKYLFELEEAYQMIEIKDQLGILYNVFIENGLLTVKNEKITFNYVGIASNARNVFCILPKYLKSSVAENQHLSYGRMLVKVLKEYGENVKHNIEGVDLNTNSSNSSTNEVALADFILNDFIRNGLYIYQSKFISNLSESEILWDYTIENSHPLISKVPYYFDTFSELNETVSNSLISRIHEWALYYTHDRYADLLDIDVNLNEGNITTSLEELGDIEYLLDILRKELRVSFNERTINLLKALIELIELSGGYYSDYYSLYGKNKFEHIWEDAISFLFKNDYKVSSKYMSHPIWKDYNSNALTEKQTLKPDVIKWVKDDIHSRLLIIDAKYYLFEFNSIDKKHNNNPGVGDIVKQYFYELILRRNNSSAEWINYQTQYINILAFPGLMGTNNKIEIIGFVSIENAAINKPIVNIYINPDFLFNNYITGKTFSDGEISEFAESVLRVCPQNI